MSAGVCVINKNGFALAADSAGTLANNVIVYNTMNKVFSLSSKLPIGAIVYDHTNLGGVFIEQIMCEFTSYLKDKQITKFNDIVELFNKFITDNAEYYQFDKSEQSYCIKIINELVTNWGKKFADSNIKKSTTEIDNVLAEFRQYIDACIHVDSDVSEYIKTHYKEIYEQKVKEVCPELKNSQEQYNRFWEYICEYFNLRMDCDSNQRIGILFAGYGEEDAFPKYIELDLYCVIGKKLKYNKIKTFDAYVGGAAIQPLAQRDVILTFCKGISETILNLVPELVTDNIISKINQEKQKLGDSNCELVKQALKDAGEIIQKKINEKSDELEAQPLMTAINCLPLAEMAFLAESLINITTLRRTYAIDGNQRTVGGPTDVAIFAKGVPTRWIKQKNYVNQTM